MLEIAGYDLLGRNSVEGVRYAWKNEQYKEYIESAAFINKTKGSASNVCGYTTSVSAGCVLKAKNVPCSFCRTGNLLPFSGYLTYKDIAKQNVFMVLTDLHCDKHPELSNKEREFAYMGQGEPGFSYNQVRLAIELTNKIMQHLGQKVHRHIFATCGVPKAINNYKNDLKNYYTERVTLHFSLHAMDNRSYIMPINDIYSFEESLEAMGDIVDITGEKPCIGIMLFNRFKPLGKDMEYTNSVQSVMKFIDKLDPKKYRLSFCEYNSSGDVGKSDIYPDDEAEKLLQMVCEKGFDAKLFSSFGKEKKSACGMLAGKKPEKLISDKWKELDNLANKLILDFTK